ncbi:MAG: ribonuclease HI [Phototrophicales bacterium]|nr:MAG: ribonuclease HI [Phototrophicales bacterium]
MVSDNELPKVTIYSDGGCSPNPGFGAWAALLMFTRENGELVEKALTGYDSQTTNNHMELTAAIQALEALKMRCEVDFYTDSQYLKNGITTWLNGWIKNGWRTADKQPVKNRDLWERLHLATQRHIIHWHWTRGHAGDRHNERVDELVNQTRMNAYRNLR